MIDFRYHLVSVIAIFMALAVGIVLGAGPLKEDIGTTLTSELTRAREDKAALNDQLARARQDKAADQSYAAATLPVVVKGRLSGRRVDVVAAEGADDQTVNGVQSALEAAGAQVPAVVRLGDEWTHPDAAGDLGTVVDQAATTLGVDRSHVGDGQLPGVVLGRVLLAGTGKDASAADTGTARQVLQQLRTKGLVTSSADAPDPASLVVTVAAPMSRKGTQGTDGQVNAYAGLVRGLDSVADGAVLASPSAPADDKDGVSAEAVVSGVRGIRAVTSGVSTVDDADRPMGQVATVLALVGQQQGQSGRYGTASDADSVVPDPTK